MNQALTIISVCVILGMCLMGALGCWYFVNSQAAEDGFFRIVDAFADGIDKVCVGFLVLLCGITATIFVCGLGRAVEVGAVSAATAYRIVAETEQLKALPTLATPYLLENETGQAGSLRKVELMEVK